MTSYEIEQRTIFDEAVERFVREWACGNEELAALYAALAFRTHVELTLRRMEFELWGWSGHPTLRELETLPPRRRRHG